MAKATASPSDNELVASRTRPSRWPRASASYVGRERESRCSMGSRRSCKRGCSEEVVRLVEKLVARNGKLEQRLAHILSRGHKNEGVSTGQLKLFMDVLTTEADSESNPPEELVSANQPQQSHRCARGGAGMPPIRRRVCASAADPASVREDYQTLSYSWPPWTYLMPVRNSGPAPNHNEDVPHSSVDKLPLIEFANWERGQSRGQEGIRFMTWPKNAALARRKSANFAWQASSHPHTISLS
jgi:hypothetical protein